MVGVTECVAAEKGTDALVFSLGVFNIGAGEEIITILFN